MFDGIDFGVFNINSKLKKKSYNIRGVLNFLIFFIVNNK